MIKTAPLDRVVDLARAVRSDDDNRRHGRHDRAKFGDRHLIFGEHFQQVRFERLVGAVELVDQQHRRGASLRHERFQNRPPDQEPLGENVGCERFAVDLALRFGKPNLDHLPRVIPLVHRRRRVEAFVALQADQLAAERGCQHLGDLRLAHARLAFEEQRPPHRQGEKYAGRQATVGEIVVLLEEQGDAVDAGWNCDGGHGNAARGESMDPRL